MPWRAPLREPGGPLAGGLSPGPVYLILGHYSVRRTADDMGECQNPQSRGMQFIASDEQIYHNAIAYTYADGSRDIIAADRRMFREPGWEAEAPSRDSYTKRVAGKKAEGDNMLRSMRRARAKLRRLALANEFQYFVTLTLDQTKIDRYDPKIITKRLNGWLDNMVRRNGLRYILVPERHKDGALHFHGFFAGENLPAVDSGHKDSCGEIVYNLPQWGYGFSTAIKLRGEYPRAVGYVCKYIGKQQGQRPMGRWYYSGGALKEPPKEYMDVNYEALAEWESAVEFSIPSGKMLVIHTKNGGNDNDSNAEGCKENG